MQATKRIYVKTCLILSKDNKNVPIKAYNLMLERFVSLYVNFAKSTFDLFVWRNAKKLLLYKWPHVKGAENRKQRFFNHTYQQPCRYLAAYKHEFLIYFWQHCTYGSLSIGLSRIQNGGILQHICI